MAFMMGVSPTQPIRNNSFRWGTYKKTTVGAAYTSTTTLTIVETSPEDVRQLLYYDASVGKDLLQIGPSTASGYVGKSETFYATAATATTLTMDSELTYDYSVGDTVSFVGTKLAGGWDRNVDYEYIQPLSIYGVSPNSGIDDKYSQRIKFVKRTAPTGNYPQFRQELGDVLINGLVYRLGAFFSYFDWAADADDTDWIRLHLTPDNGATCPILVYITKAAYTQGENTWVEVNTTGTISSEPVSCRIALMSNADETGLEYVTVSVDCFYLEHAHGTDDAASGVYTFDDIPDRGSVLFSQRDFYNTLTLANNKTVRYDPSGCGGHEIKWDCEAKFTATPMTLWANLQILKRWQDRGNLLVFHPGGDYTVDTSPYIQHIISRGETVPPVIYGYMELIPDPHDHWDLLNRISFTFKFYEV